MSTNSMWDNVGGLGEVVTAGEGGMYPTLQAAVDYLLTLPQFTERTITGTATFTKNSKAVAGVGTDFEGVFSVSGATGGIAYDTHIAIATGATRVWYPLASSVISDTSLLLDTPFAQTTAAGVSMVVGNPIHHKILVVSNLVDNVSIGSNATATDVACIEIDFNGFMFGVAGEPTASGGIVEILVNSGVIRIKNSPRINQVQQVSSESGVFVGTIHLDKLERLTKIGKNLDWILIDTCGRLFADSLHAEGDFDNFMPGIAGWGTLTNSRLAGIPNSPNNVDSISSGVRALFSADGAELTISNCTLVASCFGLLAGIIVQADGSTRTIDPEAGSALSTGNILRVSSTKLEFLKYPGTTETTLTTPAISVEAESLKIYLSNVSCEYVGGSTVTPSSAFRMFQIQPTVVAGCEVWVNNGCSLFDLRSDTARITVQSLPNWRGVHALTVQATPPAIELQAPRASVFTATLGATLITSIASVTNAPEGVEVTFTFTQDATGGRAVSGWNAAYKFHTAWVTGGAAAASTSSTVTFRKIGTNWHQISPANAWL